MYINMNSHLKTTLVEFLKGKISAKRSIINYIAF